MLKHNYEGNYAQALYFLEKSLKLQYMICLSDQPEIARTLRQIGLVHMNFQIYNEAKPYLVDALKIFTSKFNNNDHEDVKTTLETLKRVKHILRN